MSARRFLVLLAHLISVILICMSYVRVYMFVGTCEIQFLTAFVLSVRENVYVWEICFQGHFLPKLLTPLILTLYPFNGIHKYVHTCNLWLSLSSTAKRLAAKCPFIADTITALYIDELKEIEDMANYISAQKLKSLPRTQCMCAYYFRLLIRIILIVRVIPSGNGQQQLFFWQADSSDAVQFEVPI